MSTLSFARSLNQEKSFDPFKTGFDFALGLRGPWISPEYGVINVKKVEYLYE